MNGMMAGLGLWIMLVILTLLAILVLTILGSVSLVRSLQSGTTTHTGVGDDGSARDLLRRRYAAGEIDDEEFKRRLAALTWR
jgi:putative membrane protein